jgi:hypothetical protein
MNLGLSLASLESVELLLHPAIAAFLGFEELIFDLVAAVHSL